MNLEINMFWDGIFHAFAWLTALTGIFLLRRALRRSLIPLPVGMLVGGMLVGWGAFNVVEGVINHQVLALHHVLEDVPAHAAPDLAFLAFGAVLLLAGGRLVARSCRG